MPIVQQKQALLKEIQFLTHIREFELRSQILETLGAFIKQAGQDNIKEFLKNKYPTRDMANTSNTHEVLWNFILDENKVIEALNEKFPDCSKVLEELKDQQEFYIDVRKKILADNTPIFRPYDRKMSSLCDFMDPLLEHFTPNAIKRIFKDSDALVNECSISESIESNVIRSLGLGTVIFGLLAITSLFYIIPAAVLCVGGLFMCTSYGKNLFADAVNSAIDYFYPDKADVNSVMNELGVSFTVEADGTIKTTKKINPPKPKADKSGSDAKKLSGSQLAVNAYQLPGRSAASLSERQPLLANKENTVRPQGLN